MSLSDIFNAIINIFKPKPPTPVPPKPPSPPDPSSTEVIDLLMLHNHERARANLRPLNLNAKLNAAAQKHAAWMASKNKLNHSENGVKLDKRLTAEGYHFWSAGENIAMGQETPKSVMTSWMNSPGHRANILKADYKDVGFGIVVANGLNWWCADFGSPALSAKDPLDYIYEPGIFLSGPIGPEPERIAIDHLT